MRGFIVHDVALIFAGFAVLSVSAYPAGVLGVHAFTVLAALTYGGLFACIALAAYIAKSGRPARLLPPHLR